MGGQMLRRRAVDLIPEIVASVTGAGFFAWIAGLRVLSPTSVDWVLKLDWQHHFLGWHFFRNEPWSWPPGVIRSYYTPIGTAVGYTDSIPLVAIALKPFDAWLPTPMQYLGGWLLICFAAQGALGAAITGLWTDRRLHQIVGGLLFVSVPTLLGRVAHPALASHWLLLWALFLYFRDCRSLVGPAPFAALGLLCGLIHPYLAVMALAIVGATAVRRFADASPLAPRLRLAISPPLAFFGALIVGWWASGLFTLSTSADLASSGLAAFSMNLWGPFAPVGWSRFLPPLPFADPLQEFEGFQYLGLGLLVLVGYGGVLAAVRQPRWRPLAPLAVVVIAMAIYSLSPRVTLGATVITDYSTPVLDRIAVFRSTGRFFWPATYTLLSLAIAAVVTRTGSKAAAVALVAALSAQLADVSPRYSELRNTARSDAFHDWPRTLPSDLWPNILPHYKHVVFYPPAHCGPAPLPFLHAALLAGTYGLSLNTGYFARVDNEATGRYCEEMGKAFSRGDVADDTIYLLHRDLPERFRQNARSKVVCSEVDGVPVCVTEASHARWTHLARFR